MKVRWLGNACLEVFSERHILIDPHFVVKPNQSTDLLLVTHEHDDHFSTEKCGDMLQTTRIYAPKTTLDKFNLEGVAVKAGDKIDGMEVLESHCWGARESVSYFINGLLHAGDSARFPSADNVKTVFTACFPEYYDDYLQAFKKLRPNLVIPFHYDIEKDLDKAKGLKKRLNREGVRCRLLELGESFEV